MITKLLAAWLCFSLISARPLLGQEGEKVAVLWCDPLLNIKQITTRANIISIVNKASNAGVSAIALGVKTLTGELIYESAIAPRLGRWQDERVSFVVDPVEIFIAEGHKRNIEIYAVFPFFSEGHLLERQGVVYSTKPHWQTTVYAIDEDEPKVMPISEWAYGTVAFANPLLGEVQDYELSVLREFLEKYKVDGVLFDKIRFNGIDADFSIETRRKFETFLGSGKSTNSWPGDVYEFKYVNDEWQRKPGRYYRQWFKFRANEMSKYIQRAVNAVKDIDRTLPIGNFVGGWYPTYYEYGVNWASKSNIVQEPWASPDYDQTATAEIVDYLVVGCFFPRVTMEDAERVGAEWWMSVEGSSLNAMEVVDKACPVYGTILVEQYKDDSVKLEAALRTALELTNGLYIYDVSYIEKYNQWKTLQTLLKPATDGLIRQD